MPVELAKRLITVEEYHLMAEVGILTEMDRVELIRGEIIKMSPIGKRHAYVVDVLNRLFGMQLKEDVVVRIQNPIDIELYSEPEPDVVLAKPPIRTYMDKHPESSDILLLIEVADSTLQKDREIKIPLYAEAEIPAVWIVNLKDSQIEAYEGPRAGSYKHLTTYNLDESITVPGFDTVFSVKEVLGL